MRSPLLLRDAGGIRSDGEREMVIERTAEFRPLESGERYLDAASSAELITSPVLPNVIRKIKSLCAEQQFFFRSNAQSHIESKI